MRAFFAVLVVLGCVCPPAFAYQAMQGPTQTLLWDKDKAANGYTLFASHGKTYLIDMQGHLVHAWQYGTNPKWLPNGHILDAGKDDPSGFGGFVELDWDGKVVWTYNETRKDYAPHHDFLRIQNSKLGAPTTLYIANRTISQAQALAAGADPANGPYDGAQVDAIVEVDLSGQVVWEWWFLDHLVQDRNAAWPNYAGAGKTVAAQPGRLDANLPGRPLRKDWLHCNSLDYNATRDEIVINAVGGEFYVVDHGGTFLAGDPAASIASAASAKGDFLYRFGDPAVYKQGDPPSIPENWNTCSAGHKQMGGAHGVHWIEPGLPGAGHFLIFDNGQYMFERTNQSYGLEIDGFLQADGSVADHYVNPPEVGYTTFEPDKDTHKPKKYLSKQLVWRWGSKSPSGMFSHIGGSVQRLWNGNTLLCSDTEGHFIELDPSGALVWEYISPVVKDAAPVAVMDDALPMTLSVFRAARLRPDDPGLTGHVLVPQGLLAPGAGALPDLDAGAGVDSAADAGGGVEPEDVIGLADSGQAAPDQNTCACPPSGCAAARVAEASWLWPFLGLALVAVRVRRWRTP